MSFFPNLTSYVDDSYKTVNIPKSLYNDANIPSLPYPGYYPEQDISGLPSKKEHIKNINQVCATPTNGWKCKYEKMKINSNGIEATTDVDIKSEFKKAFQGKGNDLSFLDHTDNLLCQLPNIMIMLGYIYKQKSDDGKDDIYTKGGESIVDATTNKNSVFYLTPTTSKDITPGNNQTLFNACQTMMTRSRMYDSDTLKMGGFYGLKDLFEKFKSMRPILLIVLLITLYLLVQGTLSSFDVVFHIASIASGRSSGSFKFMVGLFIGIAIPMILCISFASKEIQKTNAQFGTYDVSKSPYGEKSGESTKNSDVSITVGMIIAIYLTVFFIYGTIRLRTLSLSMKMFGAGLLFLLLTSLVFMLFHWIPILSYGRDNEDDRAYGISRPLRVWLTGENREDISELTSNKFMDYNLRRFFGIYVILILAIALYYLSQSSKPVMGILPSIGEGIMVSSAILALPILWVLNWYVGIKFFMVYPMILMIVRYFRYPLYSICRSIYMNNPLLQRANPSLRAEFEKPENYSPSWDLLGMTIFKTMIKMSGNRSTYSEMFVDPANGYKDISGNSYVTGHVLRMKKGSNYTHHISTAIITVITFLFIAFGVIGKKNLS